MRQYKDRQTYATHWLSERYQQSPYQIRKYLDAVQSHIRVPQPDYFYIAKYILEKVLTNLPETKHLARQLIKNGWDSELETDISIRSLKSRKSSVDPSLSNPFISETNLRDKDASPQRDLDRHTILDQERLDVRKLPTCEHGVPVGKICNICDSEKFDEWENLQK